MRIDIVTLFPEMFAGPFGDSIIKRARENGILDIRFTQLRDFSEDKHRHVDDTPFGGGSGMVLKPEPMFRAVRSLTEEPPAGTRRVLLMDPAGTPFTQNKAKELSLFDQLIFICGHYEGYDARISEHLADESLSIGDYVLTGGELPAMVIVDAVARMLPGVLGSEELHRRIPFMTACSNIRSTQGHGNLKGWPCRKSCFPGITGRSADGAGNSLCASPRSAGRTCWKKRNFPRKIGNISNGWNIEYETTMICILHGHGRLCSINIIFRKKKEIGDFS